MDKQNQNSEIDDGHNKELPGGAFKAIFETHYMGLCIYAKSYVKNQVLAEEVVSDVFVKLWANWDRIDNIKKIDQYLYAATRNQSIKYLQHRTKVGATSDEMRDHNRYLMSEHPENILIEKELEDLANQAIKQLPEACRRSFELVRRKGYSYKEAAELQNISVFTVQTQLARAVKKLRTQLLPYLKC